jgi:hypothetical protein
LREPKRERVEAKGIVARKREAAIAVLAYRVERFTRG